jgi:predicted nucleic acid-binding protein
LIAADTNLVAYLLLDGEMTEHARKVWETDPHWVMPPLWRSEFLNVLATAYRASVLDETQAITAWQNAVHLFRGCEVEPEGEDVLRTAINLGISAYDAQFVVVAEKMDCKLVTSDKRLVKACKGRAVSMKDSG